MDKRIFHITTILADNFSRHWLVEEMAAEVRMSVPQFRRVFKESAGVTPVVFLNELRLERASHMLADPKCFLQIKEIGHHVGLPNSSYFTRDFKAKTGMSPTEFRALQTEICQSNPPKVKD